MRAAIYARVSTDRQGRQQAIDSQVDALSTWAATNSHELAQDHVYTDDRRFPRPGN
jgi:site-specific DNA recombinase